MTPAGVIPMHTPDEAVAELEHCNALGLKVVGFPEGVTRPIPDPDPGNVTPFMYPGQAWWFDHFGIDSAYDYDPVWAKAEELGFAVTCHGGLGNMPTGSFIVPDQLQLQPHRIVRPAHAPPVQVACSWVASPPASRA